MIDIDYRTLEQEVLDGMFRQRLEDELIRGFRAIQESGERLPVASHYASQIAEIVNNGAPVPLRPEFAYELYQEILDACVAASQFILSEAQDL